MKHYAVNHLEVDILKIINKLKIKIPKSKQDKFWQKWNKAVANAVQLEKLGISEAWDNGRIIQSKIINEIKRK